MAFLAVCRQSGLKREAVEGAFDRRHAARRELRTRVLWQNKKAPGAGVGAIGRRQSFALKRNLEAVFVIFLREFEKSQILL